MQREDNNNSNNNNNNSNNNNNNSNNNNNNIKRVSAVNIIKLQSISDNSLAQTSGQS